MEEKNLLYNQSPLMMRSGISKDATVVECDLQLGVFAMEIVLQTVEIAPTFPMTHRKVVKQTVATSLWRGGRHFGLGEYPTKALNGEASHVLNGICSRHNNVHAREASHRAYIHHIVLRLGIAKPSSHEVLHAVHSCRSYGRLLIGFGDAQVEGGETFIYTRHVDARLEMGVVDGKTLYDFHISLF